jgi:hypothetical protein
MEVAQILQPGQTVIMMPGETDLAGTVPLVAVYLKEETTVEVIAIRNGVTPDEVRNYNGLGSSSVIQGERWLVIPYREVIPTEASVPVATPDLSRALTEPFGPENNYIIHQVEEGDSIGLLEKLYLTSAAVIQRTNQIEGSLQIGKILVIVLQRIDPEGLVPLKAMQVENKILVEDLALQLVARLSELLYHNGLSEGTTLQVGQWVVYPDSSR